MQVKKSDQQFGQMFVIPRRLHPGYHYSGDRDLFDPQKSFLINGYKWWIFLHRIAACWLFICGE
jgi:hypothetical protein